LSFGGSQGTVRYAVMVDSAQAEQGLNRVKTGLTNLQTPTGTLSRNMASLNTTFKASVAPIQNQGNALNQLGIQQKTVGSQLKTLGSAFKNNALAIGAVASSVLGLYQNYANLSSAQNNANKSATAAKAAQNNLAKAQDNLNKAISKYGSGSKEAKAAQDKLTVAQERAVNKTESAKIAQDNLNQTMADFGINILPNIVLAGGGVTSMLSEMGGDKGLGGLVPKFKNFGSSLKTMGGNLIGVGGGIKGMIGNLGALGLAVAGAVGLYEEFNAQMKIHQQVVSGSIKPIEGATKTLDQMSKLDFTSIEGAVLSIAKLTGGSKALSDILKPEVQRLKDVDAEVKKIPPSMDKAATSTDAWVNMMIRALQSTDPKKIIEFNKAFKESGQSTERYQQILKEADAILKSFNATASKTPESLKLIDSAATGLVGTMLSEFNKVQPGKGFTGMTGLFAVDPKPISAGLDTIGAAYKRVVSGIKPATEFTKLFGDANVIVAEGMDEFRAKLDAANTGMDPFNKALQDGTDKFSDFVSQSELGAVTNKRYTDSLRQWVGQQIAIPPALDLTTSQLEAVQTALSNSKIGFTENANASKIFADALDQQLAPSVQTLGKALTALDSKEFNKAFKDLDFGAASKKFKDFSKDLDKDISQINKEAGRMNVIFSQLSIALSIDKLPHKQWVAGLEGIRKEVEKIAKTQKIDLSGITAFIKKAETIKDPVQLAKYQKVIALITSSSEGGFNPTELDAIAKAIAAIGESSGTAAPKVDKNAAAIKAFGVSSASARGQIDQVTGAVDVLKAAVSTAKLSIPSVDQTGFQKGLQLAIDNATQTIEFIKKELAKVSSIKIPAPNESTYQKGLQLAINNAAQTVKLIGSTLKKISSIKVPAPNEKTYQKGLQLAIDNAAQTVKLIGKELKKIGSIKVPAPKFNNFNSALDQAVSDAKRAVREINNALSKTKKPGGGGGTGQQGAYGGPSKDDSKADSMIFSKSNSGSGDLTVNNVIDLGSREIVRSFKRKMGNDTYTLGR
jgi:exonuclease VII small subunit